MLDKNDSQTQNQLVEQLGVSQRAFFIRLREMGKIQKIGRWVPHELNDRQMEKYVLHFARWVQENRFYIVKLLGMKSEFILRIPSAKIMGRQTQAHHHIDRKAESL